jgi:uncharacterized membrane protein YdbT with pleckstrin-like domain
VNYVEQNIIPGEVVLYKTGLHWVVLVAPLALAVLLGLPGLIELIMAALTSFGSAGAGIVMTLLGAAIAVSAFAKRKSVEMAVTNRRVIVKTGMMSRKTFELLLSKVESIGVDEGVLGRMLGYGLVIVRGTGGTPEPFNRVAHPLEFRRQVQMQIEKREQSLQPTQQQTVLV